MRRQTRSEFPRPRGDSGDDEIDQWRTCRGVQRTGLRDSFTYPEGPRVSPPIAPTFAWSVRNPRNPRTLRRGPWRSRRWLPDSPCIRPGWWRIPKPLSVLNPQGIFAHHFLSIANSFFARRGMMESLTMPSPSTPRVGGTESVQKIRFAPKRHKSFHRVPVNSCP